MENTLLTSWTQKIKENKNYKFISIGLISLLSLILLFFLYRQFIVAPAEEKANDGWWKALNYIEKDSTDQAIQILVPHVKKYDGYTGGEIGQFLLGSQYMKKGEFRLALSSLEGVSTSDEYISVMSLGLQGDCHSELKQFDKALAKYKEAANERDNEFTTPMYLFKAGLHAEKINNMEEAAVLYNKIKDDYPNYANQKTIDKYIARVSTANEK